MRRVGTDLFWFTHCIQCQLEYQVAIAIGCLGLTISIFLIRSFVEGQAKEHERGSGAFF